MFSDAARTTLLNSASALAWVSLHSAWPGAGGSNEVSASRVAAPWASATDGQKRPATPVSLTLAAGGAAKWIGVWDSQTSGSFNGKTPFSGHPLEFYVDVGSNRVRIHGGNRWADGTVVVFFGDTPPSPLVEGTEYYVRDSLSDQFRVSATPTGSAVTLTSGGGAMCLVSDITPLAAVGSSAVITLPKFFLRFIRNYDPVWSGSTSIVMEPGTTFDLKSLCSDANLDTMIFTLDAGSAALPTGVTLASDGILTCAPGSPVASLTGVIFVADDQVGD